MDRRDVNEARGGTAGDSAATGQDGRDGRDGYGGRAESLGPAGASAAQVPDEYGEPPETLEIIPGRFLRNPVAQTPRANSANSTHSAHATNAPMNGPAATSQQNVPDVTASRPYRSPSTPPATSGANPYPPDPQRTPYSSAGGTAASGGYAGVSGGQPSSRPFQGPQPDSPSRPGPRPEAGPRSVPVLSRYATSPRSTPGPVPGVTSGAISGAVRGAALGSAGAVMPVFTPPTPEQHPGNGVTPGVGPSSTSSLATASRSRPSGGPLVVEEVQETVVRDIPAAGQVSVGQGIGSPSYPAYGRQSLPAGQTPISSSSVGQLGLPVNPSVNSAANPPWRGTESPWNASRDGQVGQTAATGVGAQAGSAAGFASGRLAGALPFGLAGTPANNGVVTISLSANNAAGFSYLFGWLSGIFFYFTERANRYVRFHAMQSIILTSLFTVLAVLLYVGVEWLTLTPHATLTVVLGVSIAVLILLAMLAIWLFTLVAAWSGHYLRLPIVGRLAEHFAVPAEETYPGVDHTADMPLRA